MDSRGENVISADNGALFSHGKNWSSDAHYNVDEPQKHRAKGERPDERSYTVWFYLYEVSKKQSRGCQWLGREEQNVAV